MKLIIVESGTTNIDGDQRRELIDWAQSLGLDTRIATPTFVLIWHDDGVRAYFPQKLQRDGHDYVEPGTNRVATNYDGYSAPVDSWPSWFPGADEIPDMPAADLLQLLAVAKAMRVHVSSLAHARRRREFGAIEA